MKKRIKKDKDDPVGGKPGEKGLSMKFMNKLERKFGRYAVPNLMLYIIILNAAGLLITIMYPQAQYYLCWSTSAILHGQIWRTKYTRNAATIVPSRPVMMYISMRKDPHTRSSVWEIE